jgi:ADP-ribose pyrophosphatase YjhB (NUDIX family)
MQANGAELEAAAMRPIFNAQIGYATPKVDVRGAVFHNGKLLLVRELRDDNRWTLPGGWADVGEPPALATEREIREEAGYRAKAIKLLALYDRNLHDHPAHIFHIYKVFFRCELLDEQQNLVANIETEETGWFAEAELPALELSTGRVTLAQLQRFYAHYHHPDWPTDFD